jgi:alpha-N-acetylglucosamine transferase
MPMISYSKEQQRVFVEKARTEIMENAKLFECATGIELRGWKADERLRLTAAIANHLAELDHSDVVRSLEGIVFHLGNVRDKIQRLAAELKNLTAVTTPTTHGATQP